MESRESKKRRIYTRRLHKKKSGDIEGEISRFFLGQILPMNFSADKRNKAYRSRWSSYHRPQPPSLFSYNRGMPLQKLLLN